MNTENKDYEKLVAEAREQLFREAATHNSHEDMERIRAAYFFAEEAHRPQKRKTGEPYITHPIAVARIVSEELKLGTNTIIAALLHDVVEDTPHTIEEIQDLFGKDVAFLVAVVTKKKYKEYVTSKQVDNFKQMLDSIHYDIRALLIKLSDRLHNMRTLKSMKPEKQMKIAGETDYFYAPLANRMGLHQVKSELENLSLKYRSPHEYEKIEQLINEYVEAHQEATERWIQPIREALAANRIRATITSDKRSVYSIWRKMKEKNITFREVEHIRIVHITYDNWKELDLTEKRMALRIYSLLTDLYTEKPLSVSNYLDVPKENGYRSLHCKLMGNTGRWMEVHIQSSEMSRHSTYGCLVEEEESIDKWIARFREVLRDITRDNREGEFMTDVVTTFYPDDIYVFTDEGKRITMPKDSTALDFAYETGQQTGERAQYALINDTLCSIKTVLHRGDRVKIGTDPEVRPRQEWLDLVKTYKANFCIRQYLHAAKLEKAPSPYVLCPECNPLPGDEVVGFHEPGGKIYVHKCNCPKSISLSAQKGDIIEHVDLSLLGHQHYPVSLAIRGVDRDMFLQDLIEEISGKLKLSIKKIESDTMDEIVDCRLDLYVHSVQELNKVQEDLKQIRGIHEVKLLGHRLF